MKIIVKKLNISVCMVTLIMQHPVVCWLITDVQIATEGQDTVRTNSLKGFTILIQILKYWEHILIIKPR